MSTPTPADIYKAACEYRDQLEGTGIIYDRTPQTLCASSFRAGAEFAITALRARLAEVEAENGHLHGKIGLAANAATGISDNAPTDECIESLICKVRGLETELEKAERERDKLRAERKSVVDALNVSASEGGFDGYDESTELLRNLTSHWQRLLDAANEVVRERDEARAMTGMQDEMWRADAGWAEADRLRAENAALRAAHDKVVLEFRKVDAENAALRAALEWQPIETAPKDGTWIIVAGDSGYTTTPLRVEVCRYMPSYRPLSPWQNHANDSFRDGGTDPLYWMPLPKQARAELAKTEELK